MEPADRKYTKDHEWAKLDEGLAVVGITDYAQQQLGDIVYVELPQLGDALEASTAFGLIESVKAASDLFSPVTGEVMGINEDLVDRPELVNEDPYEGGWMIKVQPDDENELDGLMTAEKYSAYLKTLD
jgi:glycine cleavage system H protein